MGGRSGRIILLGDGREILTDSDDTEMFDHDEEDKDLDSQVMKNHAQSDDDHGRNEREETPGPQPQPLEQSNAPETKATSDALDIPSSTTVETSAPDNREPTESAEGDVKTISESAIPEKLVSPAKT